jgi:CDGSH-type Zn-finger protein
LPSVFDLQSRPWVNLRGADADAVAGAVERCPTGALRYERLDGAEGEAPERPTMVLPIENGPLLMAGDLDVRAPGGRQITREDRLTLCRCGLSHNQPFCDNSHLRRGWESGPTHEPNEPPPSRCEEAREGPTTVVPREDASLELRGDLRLYHSDGRALVEAGRLLLCRCGNSRKKPFCDGSHERVGFRSREPEVRSDRLEADSPAAFTPNPRVPDPRSEAAGP